MAYPNPPKTWSAAAVLTAAQLNAELRDALNTIIPTASTTLAWSSYTPTLTQSGAVTKTVTYAKFFQVGKTVRGVVRLDVTGSGTASNQIVVGLPVTGASSAGFAVGTGVIADASATTNWQGIAFTSGTSAVLFYPASGTTGNSPLGVQGMTAGLASGDVVTCSFVYEAA